MTQDSGHKKMAAIFYQSIHKAISENRIVAAAAFTPGATKPVCDKVAGTGYDAGGLTQRGVGVGDGNYIHGSTEMGVSICPVTVTDKKLTQLQ